MESGTSHFAALGQEGGLFHAMVMELYNVSKVVDSGEGAMYKELADAIQVTAEKMNGLLGIVNSSIVAPMKEFQHNPDSQPDVKQAADGVADYMYECEAVWRKVDAKSNEKKQTHAMAQELGKIVAKRASVDDSAKGKTVGNPTGFGEVKLRSIKNTSANPCTVCDCVGYESDVFKAGRCKNCFHAHAKS
jgi:hypothetical protein